MSRRGVAGTVAAALVAAALVVNAALLQRDYAFVDLGVYRWAAGAAFEDVDLYDASQPGTGLRFTYPPPALLLFVALDAVGLLARWSFTLLSVAALARASWLVAGSVRGVLARVSRAMLSLALVGSALLVEPGHGTILLGQVSFLLLWLGVEGLLGPLRDRAAGGVLVGVATAIKLTPGVWLLLLALTRRWRPLAGAVAAIAAAVALAWLLLPTESRSFWTGTGANADRIGELEYAANQSIQGVLWRTLGPGGSDATWVVLAIAAIAACLLLARRYDAADEPLAALGLAGLASVLASPVSWTHHWVLVLPLLVALLDVRRDRRRASGAGIVALLAGAVFASRVVWRVPQGDGREFDHTALQLLASSSYVLVGVALLGAAWLARPRPVAG